MISQEVPRRNQNMNRPITSTETESVIYKQPTNKSLGPDSVTGEFYQTIREEFILLKLLQKIAEKGTLPNSFYKESITLIPKPDKDNTEEKFTGKYYQ